MFLADTYIYPILGPLVPLFWISGDVSSVFQSQSGFCLIHFCRGKCNVHSLRFTSGATPAHLLTVGMATSHFPTCISRGRSWFGIKWAITHTEELPLCQRPLLNGVGGVKYITENNDLALKAHAVFWQSIYSFIT